MQLRLECLPKTFKHQVKCGRLADFKLQQVLSHILKHAQHRPFTNRTVLAFKGVGFRQASNRRLEQRKLIRHEWITIDEVLAAFEVAVCLRPINEVEHRAKVIGMLAIQIFQRLDHGWIFGQQSFLYDF